MWIYYRDKVTFLVGLGSTPFFGFKYNLGTLFKINPTASTAETMPFLTEMSQIYQTARILQTKVMLRAQCVFTAASPMTLHLIAVPSGFGFVNTYANVIGTELPINSFYHSYKHIPEAQLGGACTIYKTINYKKLYRDSPQDNIWATNAQFEQILTNAGPIANPAAMGTLYADITVDDQSNSAVQLQWTMKMAHLVEFKLESMELA